MYFHVDFNVTACSLLGVASLDVAPAYRALRKFDLFDRASAVGLTVSEKDVSVSSK